MESWNDEDHDPDFTPDEWELCADHFLLMIKSMREEGFTIPQLLTGLSFAIADLAQSQDEE